MKSFKQFCESYVPENDGPLYHFTSGLGLNGILKNNSIMHSRNSKSTNSLTRDSNLYNTADVRIKLNRSSISKRHKLEHYWDPFVALDNTGDKLTGDKDTPEHIRKGESEERIHGPIKNIDKHIEEIGISHIHHKNLLASRKNHLDSITALRERQQKQKEGYFWHNQQKTYKPITKELASRVNISDEQFTKWKSNHMNSVSEIDKILKHPK